MSSSSYSNSLEVKARSLEVQRFPGIGFSSCAASTYSHVQGILNGGYESEFLECAGMEKVYRNDSEYECKE